MVVIASSAGGIPALGELLSNLPETFPLPIAITQHRAATRSELLPGILQKRCALRVKLAEEGERLRQGFVYVAPSDRHLVIRPNRRAHLMDGSRIRHVLSSANPLFDSAAYALDGRVIAVVLTGGGSDATDGVQTVKGMGGFVIAEDPTTAHHASMPRSAIETGAVDRILPLARIAAMLIELTGPETTT